MCVSMCVRVHNRTAGVSTYACLMCMCVRVCVPVCPRVSTHGLQGPLLSARSDPAQV